MSFVVRFSLLLIPALLLTVRPTLVRADAIETAARQAIIVDYKTGAVLMEKNADEIMTPSSMSKLMTVYLVFSHLKDGSLKLTDELPVSETAWKKHYKSDESMMFLPVHGMVKVDDLLRGVIIQSGNDACSVLAEGLAGSEEAFAEQETEVGKKIGLLHSTFRNASGVPDPDHKMTARDLAVLARHLITDFPDYYPIFSEKTFTYNNIKQDNRNPLIWQNIAGADGLKTGHTEEAGYGLTGSVMRNGRRIIIVLNGLPTLMSRAEESQRLIEWAFREYDDYDLYQAGEVLGQAPVTEGVVKTVPLAIDRSVTLTLPRTTHADLKATVHVDEAVKAPVVKGTVFGSVTLAIPGRAETLYPLVAGADVARLGVFGRLSAKVHDMISGSGK